MIIYTDGGNRTINGLDVAAGGTYVKLDEQEWVYGEAFTHEPTNNRAEMTGYINGLKTIIEYTPKEVHMYLDSMYVLDGSNKYLYAWIKRNWVKADGQPVKNADLWKQIVALKAAIGKMGIPIKHSWVRGHSGVYGNEMADQVATEAMVSMALQRNPIVKRILKDAIVANADIPVEWEQTLKKLPAPNPWIPGRRVVGESHRPFNGNDDYTIYMSASWDDTGKTKGRNAGLAHGESFEAISLTKATCPVLELMRRYQNSVVEPHIIRPVIYLWDRIKASSNWKNWWENGPSKLSHQRGNVYYMDNDNQMTYYMRTPRLSQRIIDGCNNKLLQLNLMQNGKVKPEHVYDITDVIYEEGKKGKQAARKELQTAKSIKIPVVVNDVKRTIILAINYEMPGRTTFANIAADTKVKVELVLTNVLKRHYRYMLVITGEDGNVICCNNPHTCQDFLP